MVSGDGSDVGVRNFLLRGHVSSGLKSRLSSRGIDGLFARRGNSKRLVLAKRLVTAEEGDPLNVGSPLGEISGAPVDVKLPIGMRVAWRGTENSNRATTVDDSWSVRFSWRNRYAFNHGGRLSQIGEASRNWSTNARAGKASHRKPSGIACKVAFSDQESVDVRGPKLPSATPCHSGGGSLLRAHRMLTSLDACHVERSAGFQVKHQIHP